MNKYSDISNRSCIFHGPNSRISPKQVQSLRDSISLKEITYNRYHSESPEASLVMKPRSVLLSPLGISKISSEHNQRVIDQSDVFTPIKSSPIKLPEIIPKHSDFSTILDKIEKVISPRTKLLHFFLKEDEGEKFTQASNEFKYFRVLCKGKKCPMQVKIKVYEGKIISYVSFTESQPSQAVHDRVYNYCYFEVSEKNYCFKNENVFIGIRSFVYSVYKVKVCFGKVATLADIKKGKQETIRNELDDQKIVQDERIKTLNFIKKNIETIGSPLIKFSESKQEGWENKKKQAKINKKEHFKQKREKALERLTRKERKFEENLKKLHLSEIENNRKKSRTLWLSLLFFHKTISFIHSKIRAIRLSRLTLLRKTNESRKIQRFFRSKLKIPSNSLKFLIMNHNLLTYLKHSRPIQNFFLKKTLVSSIIFAAHRNELAHDFQVFTKKITIIQRHVRELLGTKEKRLFELIQHWNRIIEKNLFSKRTKADRRKTSLNYTTIPHSRRNDVLQVFYREKWRKFRDFVKEIIFKFKPYRIVKRFLSDWSEPLRFNFLTTDSEMVDMIQLSIKENS
jgi:hypothetical protein